MTTDEMIDAFASMGFASPLLDRKRLARLAVMVTTYLTNTVHEAVPEGGEREHLVVSLLVVHVLEDIFQKTLDRMLGDDDGGTL